MKHNPFSLEGKVVLVTGASSGIGAQCAIDCSNMGARVILVGRNETRLNETLTQMTGDGHTAICYDLGNLNGIAELVEQLHNSYIHIDGLIHGAGIEKTIPLKFLLPQDYEEVWRINTLSAFEYIQRIRNNTGGVNALHFLPVLFHGKRGKRRSPAHEPPGPMRGGAAVLKCPPKVRENM